MIVLKIDYNKSEELIIYLFNNQYNIKLNKEDNLEKYLKKIFLKLKKYYGINIEGYYEVNIYIDNKYGIILKLKQHDFDYYNYSSNQVDMKIKLFYKKFWFLVDSFNFDLNKYDAYKYKDNIYLYPKYKLTKKEFAYLIENSIIIYDNDEILNHARKISFKCI